MSDRMGKPLPLDARRRVKSQGFIAGVRAAASGNGPHWEASMGRTDEASDQGCDFIRGRVEREMPGIEDVDLGFWDIAAVGFRLREVEREVVLAPDDQEARLL